MTTNPREFIDKAINNIFAWSDYWYKNGIYSILSREIYKMSSRNTLTYYPKSVNQVMESQHRKEVRDKYFSNKPWLNNGAFLNNKNLMEHFEFEHYDNILGAKIEEILGSFTRAKFSPRLKIQDNSPFSFLAQFLNHKLEDFLDHGENKRAIINCFDNVLCCGYGALKFSYKTKKLYMLEKDNLEELELFLENVNFPEFAFFNPYSKSETKTDSPYDDPNSFAGTIIQANKKSIEKQFNKTNLLSLPINNRKSYIQNSIPDNRKDLIYIAEYYDYVDYKVRKTIFCGNEILSQNVYEWDFIPMIFVAGNSSYVGQVQQIHTIFDKSLTIQKEYNFVNNVILKNVASCKGSTIAFERSFGIDEQQQRHVIDTFHERNVIELPTTTRGMAETMPPTNLGTVELPQSVMLLRNEYLLTLEKVLMGNYSDNDSNFGESGRALQMKLMTKSNLFGRQLGNLNLALNKFCEFFKKMFYLVDQSSFSLAKEETIINQYPNNALYEEHVDNFMFDVLIDPDISITQTANREWVAEAMPLCQANPVLTETMFFILLDNSDLPNKEEIKEATKAKLAQAQEEARNTPDPMLVIQEKEMEQEKLALQMKDLQSDKKNDTTILVKAMDIMGSLTQEEMKTDQKKYEASKQNSKKLL